MSELTFKEFLKGFHRTFWENIAGAALMLGLFGIGIYAYATNGILTFAVLLLLALAATSGGAVLGFLFGVPRYKGDTKDDGGYVPNTNLEQVSDWLTKIIIGATLVQAEDIAAAIGRLSTSVAAAIKPPESAIVPSTILVYSVICGFIWSYLWTSVRLMKELHKREQAHQLRAGDKGATNAGL